MKFSLYDTVYMPRWVTWALRYAGQAWRDQRSEGEEGLRQRDSSARVKHPNYHHYMNSLYALDWIGKVEGHSILYSSCRHVNFDLPCRLCVGWEGGGGWGCRFKMKWPWGLPTWTAYPLPVPSPRLFLYLPVILCFNSIFILSRCIVQLSLIFHTLRLRTIRTCHDLESWQHYQVCGLFSGRI